MLRASHLVNVDTGSKSCRSCDDECSTRNRSGSLWQRHAVHTAAACFQLAPSKQAAPHDDQPCARILRVSSYRLDALRVGQASMDCALSCACRHLNTPRPFVLAVSASIVCAIVTERSRRSACNAVLFLACKLKKSKPAPSRPCGKCTLVIFWEHSHRDA